MPNTYKVILSIMSAGAAWLAIKNNLSYLGLYYSFLTLIFILFIDYSKIDQKLGWGIFISACSVSSALSVLGDEMSFPKICKGRGRILCEIENLLFSIGGVYAVATFYFLVGIILFRAIRYSKYNNQKL
ncbi:MAG: hypothetical protein HOP36_10465 [Methyloglobulus sp.]|nr:hypothetical protein [Methyloglobulus sp.]